MAELFSVRADLHPPATEYELAVCETDLRCAFAEWYGEAIRGLPDDRRQRATVLRRRAVDAETYALLARQAASVADQLADQESTDPGRGSSGGNTAGVTGGQA